MNYLSGTSILGSLVPAPLGRWAYVRPRFQGLLESLKITADQAEDGETKHKGVLAALNATY